MIRPGIIYFFFFFSFLTGSFGQTVDWQSGDISYPGWKVDRPSVFDSFADSSMFTIRDELHVHYADENYTQYLLKKMSGRTDSINAYPGIRDSIFYASEIMHTFSLTPTYEIKQLQRVYSGKYYRFDFSVYGMLQPVSAEGQTSLKDSLAAIGNTPVFRLATDTSGYYFIRKLSSDDGILFFNDFGNGQQSAPVKLKSNLFGNLEMDSGAHIELYVIDNVKSLKKGILLSSPGSKVEPLFFKYNGAYYYFKKSYVVAKDILYNYSDVGSSMKLSSDVPLLRIKSGNDGLFYTVQSELRNEIEKRLAAAPFNATLETRDDALLIMFNNKKKSDLLGGKYELSTYVVYVNESHSVNSYAEAGYSGIKILINLNILTANHPANSFYDPSDKEMDVYNKALKKVQDDAARTVCYKHGGKKDLEQYVIIK